MNKKKCRYCKEYQQQNLMIKVNLGYFCSYDHAASHGLEKARHTIEKQIRANTQKAKQKLLTKTDWISIAEKSVRDYIRERDKNKPCISCGGTPRHRYGGGIDAGHYRSKGAAKQLRFNTLNIHAQCKKCNRDLSGNVVEYRKGLIEKIGLERVLRIEYDNTLANFSIDYLKRLDKIFKKRKRHLIKIRRLVENRIN